MIKLRAPYPVVQTMMLLPNPVFGDSEAPRDTVQIRRAMDGTMYSYVRTTEGRRELQFELNLTRLKALELVAFMRSYHASVIELTDTLGQIWIGNFTNEATEIENSERAEDKPGREMTNVRLTFEGVLQ